MDVEKFKSGAIRENKTGKGRCDLLPMCALIRLSKHYEAGSTDHGERNWEKGIPMHSFLDSAIRHLFKYMDGQVDEDHLCAAAWNILGAMWTEEKRPDMQDIPTRTCLTYRLGGSSLDSGLVGEVTQGCSSKSQEKAKKEPTSGVCSCHSVHYDKDANGFDHMVERCIGTKEMDICSCKGDRSKCDFYDYVRKESTNGDG